MLLCQNLFVKVVALELFVSGIVVGRSPNGFTTIGNSAAFVSLVTCACYESIWYYRSFVLKENDEYAIDFLRYSDWIVTLPATLYGLHTLAETNEQYTYAFFTKEACVLLSTLAVLCAAGWRFGFNELRPPVTLRQSVTGALLLPIGALLMLCLCLTNLLYTLAPDMTHYLTINILALVWTGYPMVVLTQRILLPEHESLYKDASYGVLDLISKSGFACYVVFL